MFKALVKKVVAWASHKYALYYLSFLCFIESIFFPIPPDVMLIPMALARIQKWFKIASVALLSTLTGAVIGYIIGYFFYKEVGIKIFEFYNFNNFQEFKEYLQVGKGFWAWIIIMTIAGYSPVPFKLLTITSGFIHFPFHIFIIITILIRGTRFFFLCWLCHYFGAKIIKYMEQKAKKIITVLLGLFCLGVFLGYLIYEHYNWIVEFFG